MSDFSLPIVGFIKAASKLHDIQVLQIGNLKQITNEVIDCLGQNSKKLDLLDLSKCTQITDKCADSLKNLQLTKLSLSHTKVSLPIHCAHACSLFRFFGFSDHR